MTAHTLHGHSTGYHSPPISLSGAIGQNSDLHLETFLISPKCELYHWSLRTVPLFPGTAKPCVFPQTLISPSLHVPIHSQFWELRLLSQMPESPRRLFVWDSVQTSARNGEMMCNVLDGEGKVEMAGREVPPNLVHTQKCHLPLHWTNRWQP